MLEKWDNTKSDSIIISKKWKIFNFILSWKILSSENWCRWRVRVCYAYKHILFYFTIIFKSFTVIIDTKTHRNAR